ncbi:hypothetical protein [Capnocytophaga leadbetteri]|uniref:hypothetical protein n=1 Tax=Capnocytophaga leadbetteri TaxID=327575 RepID=UPI0028E41F5A|nr:hypothetical protein [Capnocytophaga leadbetteri]
MSTKEKQINNHPMVKKPLRKTSHYTVLEVDTSLDKYINAPIFTKKLARVNEKLEKVGLPKTIVN